jgi:CBS domain-containing membrane protein
MSFENLKVNDIMTREVKTLGRNDTLDIARDVMALGRIRHLPVLDDGKVVGVVSQRDLFSAGLVAALGYGSRTQTTLLKTVSVKEVMSEPPITVSPEVRVTKAARLMMEKKIGCLPVVEGETLVGLVTETDLLRLIAG